MNDQIPIYNERHLPSLLKDIYDEYKTSLFNFKYNSYKLNQCINYNKYIDIAIAFGGGSSIASFALWRQTEIGRQVWEYLSNGAAILYIIKPFVDYGGSIKEYSRLTTEYANLSDHYASIVREIQASRFIIQKTGDLPGELNDSLEWARRKKPPWFPWEIIELIDRCLPNYRAK